jgi:hypothetical protein
LLKPVACFERSEGLPDAIDSYEVLIGKRWEMRRESLPVNDDHPLVGPGAGTLLTRGTPTDITA